MKSLSQNWITEKAIDFEYKKYLLLAYLQEVQKHFEQSKLYPVLSDLISHYRNIVQIKENKDQLFSSFPERMKGIDAEQFRLFFEKIIQDDSIMLEIESIIEYSIPKFEYFVNEGKKIYDFIEGKLCIYPIGIVPLSLSEGYFFLRNGDTCETRLYEYHIHIFDRPDEKYRGLDTKFIGLYSTNLINTVEMIKTAVIKQNKSMPNPATYLIETEMPFPLEEALFPIAKRLLVRYVAVEGKI